MKIIDVVQGTDEWHAWRSTGIGASDSAAVLGKSDFKTAYQLFLEMTGRVPRFTGNIATNAGKESEEKARSMFEMMHGDFETFEPICVQHPIYDFMLASLDGFNKNQSRLLEIKYPSEKSHLIALSGNVPEHYQIQMQHQLACCTDAKIGSYWSFREAYGAHVVVKPDLRFIEEILIPSIISFMELVKTDVPPALTDKDSKWEERPEIISLFQELKFIDDKEKKNALSAQIINLAGHDKVRCHLAQVTSVKRNGSHSFYKITRYDKDDAI